MDSLGVLKIIGSCLFNVLIFVKVRNR
jgi:hypothetical protein